MKTSQSLAVFNKFSRACSDIHDTLCELKIRYSRTIVFQVVISFDSYLNDNIVKGGFPCNFPSSECHPNDEYLQKCQQKIKTLQQAYPFLYQVTLAQFGQISSDNTPATGMMSERISSKIRGNGWPLCLQLSEKT